MAVMWPKELPLSIRQDRRRKAEVRTYDKLRQELDDNFTVFYSSPWLGTDSLGAERDGECDFLVAHAELGYLAIEVKGGGISWDPATLQWTSTDENKFIHKIKDPVHQARSAKHEMLKKLQASGKWHNRFIKIGHGVVFPNAESPPRELGADKPRRIFCCSKEFAHDLRGWIGQRMYEGRRPENCKRLGADGLAALTHILANPFQLSFTIASAMDDAAEHLGVLEPTQFWILDHICDVPRAEIRGGAGTGKTVIAAEEAIRQARDGKKVLLTCHSAPLAAHLARLLKGTPGLTVSSFHSLCGTLAAKAGIKITGVGQMLYDEDLPAALIDAAALLPSEKWDAVVVDEAQDFRESWWIALSSIMSPGCALRILSDSNQRVYDTGRIPGQELKLVPIRLSKNLRNTELICEAASVHYKGHQITPVGPRGPEVIWVEADGINNLAKAAVKELRRLIFSEEIAPADIAVLVPDAERASNIRQVASSTNIEFSDCTDLTSEAVILDTVRRFKGLERAAVILLVAPCDMLECELAYVGMTRPRTFLAVISTKADQSWLRQKLDIDDA